MKHLKTYNESISKSEYSKRNEMIVLSHQNYNHTQQISITCYDILIDLTDDKYFTSVEFDTSSFAWPLTLIKIHIRNDKDKFVLSDVESVSNRLEKYLELEGLTKTRTSDYICGGLDSTGAQKERQYEIEFKGRILNT